MRKMMWMKEITGVLLACVAAAGAAQVSGGNQPHGTADGLKCDIACQQSPTEIAALNSALDGNIAKLPTTGFGTATPDTRDLTNGALAQLIRKGITSASPLTGDKLQCALWVAAAFKDLSTYIPSPGTDGNNKNLLFTLNTNAANNDQNATEFAMLGLGAILASKRLSLADIVNTGTANAMPDVAANILIALQTLQDHTASGTETIPVSYTNIYLMNTVAQMLVGQGIKGTYPTQGNAAIAIAENQQHLYLTEIQTRGVHEFDSPTYSGTQMESLVEGYKYAANSNDKHNFKVMLDYLFLDLATNYFSGNIKVAGPLSRDYDFRNGQGSLQSWIEVLAGWTTGTDVDGTVLLKSDAITLELAELLDAVTGTSTYTVPPSTYQLATSRAARTVLQYWGNPGHRDSNAVGSSTPVRRLDMFNNAAIGCTSGNYGPQDKMFVAALSGLLNGSATAAKSNRGQGLITNVLDSSGNPYGTSTTVDASGHAKPHHLQENMACVQSNGVALMTTWFSLWSRDTVDTGLATNILFPINTKNFADTNFPVLRVDSMTLPQLIAASACHDNHTAQKAATIYVCPLTVNQSVITLTGKNGGVVGLKVVEATNTPVAPLVDGIAATWPYEIEIDLEGSKMNDGTTDLNSGGSDGIGRIVINHANGQKTGTPPAAYPRVSWLAVANDDLTPDNTILTLQNSAVSFTDTNNVPASNQRTFAVTFGNDPSPSHFPGSPNQVNALSVVRSSATSSFLADPGIPSATPALPIITDPTMDALTQINAGGSTIRSAYNFWQNNQYQSPTWPN